MKGTMADYEIQSITETALMDVYRVKLDKGAEAPKAEAPKAE
jgi:hypothetical protein